MRFLQHRLYQHLQKVLPDIDQKKVELKIQKLPNEKFSATIHLRGHPEMHAHKEGESPQKCFNKTLHAILGQIKKNKKHKDFHFLAKAHSKSEDLQLVS